jgi:hypothetical protein
MNVTAWVSSPETGNYTAVPVCDNTVLPNYLHVAKELLRYLLVPELNKKGIPYS